jgi:hypothetical protein
MEEENVNETLAKPFSAPKMNYFTLGSSLGE